MNIKPPTIRALKPEEIPVGTILCNRNGVVDVVQEVNLEYDIIKLPAVLCKHNYHFLSDLMTCIHTYVMLKPGSTQWEPCYVIEAK